MEHLKITVESVLSGTVLRGQPSLSGYVAKSQNFHNINTIEVLNSYLYWADAATFSTVPMSIFHCFKAVLNGQRKACQGE